MLTRRQDGVERSDSGTHAGKQETRQRYIFSRYILNYSMTVIEPVNIHATTRIHTTRDSEHANVHIQAVP